MTKVNLDKIQASKVGNIESVIHTADLNNGVPVALGALVAGENELHQVVAPSDASEVLLLATPEVDNTAYRYDGLDKMNKANEAHRAYHLTEGDRFTVETALFVAAPAVGDIVEATADFKYEVNAVPAAKTQFRVEKLKKIGADSRDAVVLKVVKA